MYILQVNYYIMFFNVFIYEFAGLMMESEKKIIEMMDGRSPMSKYWMPLVWATNIINRARKESLITSDHIVQTLLQELSDIRRRLGALIGYDTVCVPLVYTQVSTQTIYLFINFRENMSKKIEPQVLVLLIKCYFQLIVSRYGEFLRF